MKIDNYGLPYTTAWNGQIDFGDSSAELGRWWLGKILTENTTIFTNTFDTAIKMIEHTPGIGVRHPSNPFPPNSNFWSDPKSYSRDNQKPYLWLAVISGYHGIFQRMKEKHAERGGYRLQNGDFMDMNSFDVIEGSPVWRKNALFDLGSLLNVLVQLTPLPKYEHDKPWYKRITFKRNIPGNGLERDWLNLVVDMACRKYQGNETIFNKLAWKLAKKFGSLYSIFHEYYKSSSGNNYEIAEYWFTYFENN